MLIASCTKLKPLAFLSGTLMVIVWLLPNHYSPWLSFHSETLAFVALTLLGIRTLIVQPVLPLWTVLANCVAAMALLPWFPWFAGVSPFAGDALMTSYFFLGWAIAIVLGYNLARFTAAQSVLALMNTLWIAAMLSSVIGLIQWLKLEEVLGIFIVETEIGAPAAGNLAQPNQLATLLLMGMVCYGYVFERRIIGLSVFALGIVVMTVALVLTHSRSGMLGILTISSFALVKGSRVTARLRTQHIVVWLLLFAVVMVGMPYVEQALLLNSEREPLFSSNGRMLIWSQIIEGIGQSPWMGYGWNQTATAQMTGAVAHPGELTVAYAHNVLFDIIAWSGLPIGLTLIGLGGYWFCTRIYRVTGLDAGYAMACLLPFTIHSMVEFPFAYAYFLLAAGLMMGIVEASMGVAKEWRVRRFWLGSALTAWAIIGSYIAYEYFLIEEDFRIVRFESLRIGSTDASYQIPNVWMLSHMATMLKVARQPAIPDMSAQQLDDLRSVASRFPYEALTLRYALALGLNGDQAGASHTMAVIQGLYGEKYYKAAKIAWHDKAKKYPQLDAVHLP